MILTTPKKIFYLDQKLDLSHKTAINISHKIFLKKFVNLKFCFLAKIRVENQRNSFLLRSNFNPSSISSHFPTREG